MTIYSMKNIPELFELAERENKYLRVCVHGIWMDVYTVGNTRYEQTKVQFYETSSWSYLPWDQPLDFKLVDKVKDVNDIIGMAGIAVAQLADASEKANEAIAKVIEGIDTLLDKNPRVRKTVWSDIDAMSKDGIAKKCVVLSHAHQPLAQFTVRFQPGGIRMQITGTEDWIIVKNAETLEQVAQFIKVVETQWR